MIPDQARLTGHLGVHRLPQVSWEVQDSFRHPCQAARGPWKLFELERSMSPVRPRAEGGHLAQ
jgi:hypothetical protein